MEKILQYISKILIQDDSVDSDYGLFYGKMGIAVFLFHYARFASDQSYREKAVLMINSCIKEAFLQHHNFNYANGWAGVGTGIEYLVQNDFVNAETNKVLEKIDKIIFYYTVHGNRSDASLFTGLSGLGRYLLFRIDRQCANDDHICTLDNKMLLISITDIFERRYPLFNNVEIVDVLGFLNAMDRTNIFPTKVKRLLPLILSDTSFSNQGDMSVRYKKTEELYCSKYNQLQAEIQKNTPLTVASGLYEGLAGIGLYLLSKLDKQHNSWMQLL